MGFHVGTRPPLRLQSFTTGRLCLPPRWSPFWHRAHRLLPGHVGPTGGGGGGGGGGGRGSSVMPQGKVKKTRSILRTLKMRAGMAGAMLAHSSLRSCLCPGCSGFPIPPCCAILAAHLAILRSPWLRHGAGWRVPLPMLRLSQPTSTTLGKAFTEAVQSFYAPLRATGTPRVSQGVDEGRSFRPEGELHQLPTSLSRHGRGSQWQRPRLIPGFAEGSLN